MHWLLCLLARHSWVRCSHYWSAVKIHWHCARCGASRVTPRHP